MTAVDHGGTPANRVKPAKKRRFWRISETRFLSRRLGQPARRGRPEEDVPQEVALLTVLGVLTSIDPGTLFARDIRISHNLQAITWIFSVFTRS
jgi:hypothetical protein